ncbi:MAG: CpsD/CapB family tyrosine-protein kinase [Chloroflexota bacterium]
MSESAKTAAGPGLISDYPDSAVAEAFRTLRTNIQFSSVDRELKAILVLAVGRSPRPELVAANLAISFADVGRRTILVDCDLREPRLQATFALAGEQGLTTLILEEQAQPPLRDTGIPNLSLLASGPVPPNPADILASDRMARVVNRLREDADMVVLYGSPAATASDALALAPRVDGVLLVVEAGQTRRDAARAAAEGLARVGARVLGVVLNNVKRS